MIPDSSPPAAATTALLRTHLRGSTLLLVGRQLSLLANLAVQVLTVRYLAQSDYGAFAYALSFVTPAATVSALGFERGVSRFTSIYQEQGDHDKVLGTLVFTLGTVLLLGTVLVLGLFGFRQILGGVLAASPLSFSLLGLLLVLAPVQALESLFTSVFAVFVGARAIFFRRHVLGPGLKLAAVLAVIGLRGDVFGVALAYVGAGLLATLASAALVVRILRQRGILVWARFRTLVVPWRELLSFCLPLGGSDLVRSQGNLATVWLLQFFHSLSSVALFRAVLPAARLNQTVSTSFRALYTPLAARFYARGDVESMDRLYWQTASWITLLTFPIFAITFALAEPVTVLMFGDTYADAGLPMAIMSFGFFCSAALGFNVLTLRVLGQVRILVVTDLAAVGAVIVLDLLLVPAYGAVGGAVALTSTLVAQNVVYQLALARHGIMALPHHFGRLYATTILAGLCLYGFLHLSGAPVMTALVTVPLAVVGLFWANRRLLDVRATFPEMMRVPLVRQVLTTLGA